MTDAYDYFQQGKAHLKNGMAAQATVALEKAKKLEPDKASIREALGSHGYGYYRPDPAMIAAAATDARSHLGGDRYYDALDTGRGLSAGDAAAMLRASPPGT